MKKIFLSIAFLLVSVIGFSQARTLAGFYPNGQLGKKIPDTVLSLNVQTPLFPINDSTFGSHAIDSLRRSSDSVYAYKDGQWNFQYKDSTGGGGGSGWGLSGNAVTAGVDFMGSTNNTSVRFKTNNTERVVFDSLGGIQVTGGRDFLAQTQQVAFRGTTSDASQLSVTMELVNTAAAGKTYEIRSVNDGTFDIIDRTNTKQVYKYNPADQTTQVGLAIRSVASGSFYLGAGPVNGLWIGTAPASITTGNVNLYGDGTNSVLNASSGGGVYFSIGLSTKWQMNSSSHFVTMTDNVYDIGASGATRPRTGYFGTSVVSPIVTVTGRLHTTQGAAVASTAGAMTLGTDGNIFEITGTNAITLLSNVSWQNGDEVTLMFTSTATLKNATATSGTNITMLLAGAVDFVATADDVVVLQLGTIGGVQAWRERSRSVN